MAKKIKRNTPIATLIKNYVNRTKGKVMSSRNEIKWRFEYLDWRDQKKILMAFLESGKKDRQWAYSKMMGYWDDAFQPKMKELWEQLHEEGCALSVIHFFSKEYVMQHLEQFSYDKNYYFICLRFAEDKDFVIDKSKLSSFQYLSVLHQTGRSIGEEEAADALYGIVHDICVGNKDEAQPWLGAGANTERGAIISPIHFLHVALALYFLDELNHSLITLLFREWNQEVQRAIMESQDYRRICQLDGNDYRVVVILLAKKYSYLALDDKYKLPTDPDVDEMLPKVLLPELVEEVKVPVTPAELQPEPEDPEMLEEMMDENPALERLVDDLDLSYQNPDVAKLMNLQARLLDLDIFK